MVTSPLAVLIWDSHKEQKMLPAWYFTMGGCFIFWFLLGHVVCRDGPVFRQKKTGTNTRHIDRVKAQHFDNASAHAQAGSAPALVGAEPAEVLPLDLGRQDRVMEMLQLGPIYRFEIDRTFVRVVDVEEEQLAVSPRQQLDHHREVFRLEPCRGVPCP